MIHYDDYTHTYWNDKKLIYESTSKVLTFIKQPFNAKEISEEYAQNHGMTPEYWRDQWNKKSKKALYRGNTIHNEKEEADQGRRVAVRRGRIWRVHNPELFTTDNLFTLPDGVYTEIKLWNHEWHKAGRADKIIIETDPEDDETRYVDVLDYKTNQKIEKKSFYNWTTKKYRMLKKPLNHIMDSSYWHYTLQLSMYAFFLEAFGYTVRNLELIHTPHPFEFEGHWLRPEDKTYQLEYLREDVLKLLAHYNKYHSYEYRH